MLSLSKTKSSRAGSSRPTTLDAVSSQTAPYLRDHSRQDAAGRAEPRRRRLCVSS